jgi:hypothetical protein
MGDHWQWFDDLLAALPLDDPAAATPAERPWRPEDGDTRCQECGRPNPVWFTDHATWNSVMGSEAGILCPTCFALKAGGPPGRWYLSLVDHALSDRREPPDGADH